MNDRVYEVKGNPVVSEPLFPPSHQHIVYARDEYMSVLRKYNYLLCTLSEAAPPGSQVHAALMEEVGAAAREEEEAWSNYYRLATADSRSASLHGPASPGWGSVEAAHTSHAHVPKPQAKELKAYWEAHREHLRVAPLRSPDEDPDIFKKDAVKRFYTLKAAQEAKDRLATTPLFRLSYRLEGAPPEYPFILHPTQLLTGDALSSLFNEHQVAFAQMG